MKGSTPKKYVARDGTVSWRATVDLPRGPDNKRRQRQVTAPTKKELDARIAQLLADAERGGFTEVDARKLTLGEYLRDRWLPSAEPQLRAGTVDSYRNAVNKHIEPALGRLLLSKVTPMHLQRFYADRLVKGLAAGTVAVMHAILRRALKQAVRWRLLTHNPSDGVEPPRGKHREFDTWTAEQAATFLAATANDELAALWRLALLTGMRRGELVGLRWEDVDLSRGVLAVAHSLVPTRSAGLVESAPKTAAGRRQIALPASVVEALRAHRTRQKEHRLAAGPAYDDQGYVFADRFGKVITPATVNARFAARVAAAGLPHIRFHDLRHTCATLMLKGGEHPKIVQERLGHSKVSMTLDRYSHVTSDMQRGAADRLDKMIQDAS